jgi:outer membrane lipoprotein-sorting protein
MNCLSTEQLVSLVLGDPPVQETAVRDHLRRCPTCADALARVQADLSRVADAHAWFERGHARARVRLLAALDGAKVEQRVRPRQDGFPAFKGSITMRRVLIAGAAVAALVGLLLAWPAAQPLSALAQTANALRKVKSYRCRLTLVESGADEKAKEKQVGVLCWAAPGSWRMELHEAGKPANVSILLQGKPGLEIDHKDETYSRLEPLYARVSPVELANELANYGGKADRELPERKIKGKATKGFEIAINKIDPDLDEGTLRVWPDPETKLPLRVELDIPQAGKEILDEFAWEVPTEKWFDTEPPAKYQDKTPAPASVEEVTKHIVKGLKTYLKYCGEYPPVKMVYGDVTSKRLYAAAGLSDPHKVAPREEMLRDEYAECSPARFGFACINTIQRHNPDAAYYGKSVGPNDKEKVLFRWKLEDGSYRVIFGDLRAETVNAEKLKELEKR